MPTFVKLSKFKINSPPIEIEANLWDLCIILTIPLRTE